VDHRKKLMTAIRGGRKRNGAAHAPEHGCLMDEHLVPADGVREHSGVACVKMDLEEEGRSSFEKID